VCAFVGVLIKRKKKDLLFRPKHRLAKSDILTNYLPYTYESV